MSNENRVDSVIRSFQNASGSDRLELFSRLQEFPFEEISDVLVMALKDKNHRVRNAASKMIGKYGDETIVTRLLHLLYDDSWIVRNSAQDALKNLSFSIVLPAVRGVLATLGNDSNLQKSLASIIAQYDRIESSEILINMFKNTSDNRLKSSIVDYLGRQTIPESIEFVFKCLNDPSWDVRKAAVKSISQTSKEVFLDRAIEALSNPERQVNLAAIEILIKQASDDVIDALAEVLTKGNSLGRLNALSVLKGIRNDECLTLIVSSLSDRNANVRRRAIEILAETNSPVVFSLLKRCLRSTNWDLKQGAIRTLAALGTEEAEDLLEELLTEKNTAVKITVLEGLAKIGGRRAVRLIMQYASFDEIGKDAIGIIKSLDPDMAIPHLISFLTDEKYYTHTVNALKNMERPKVLRYLASRVASGSIRQQEKALKVLGELGGMEAEKYLRNMLEASPSAELKSAIQKAIDTIQRNIR